MNPFILLVSGSGFERRSNKIFVGAQELSGPHSAPVIRAAKTIIIRSVKEEPKKISDSLDDFFDDSHFFHLIVVHIVAQALDDCRSYHFVGYIPGGSSDYRKSDDANRW